MDLKSQLEASLLTHLSLITPKHWFADVYKYVLLPPGKLFRPQLVFAIEKDFVAQASFKDDPHAYLASAIEIHHTYTLLHDDLPCMDNDDYRRSRLTAHKKFGEWEALLAGDGLLNGSYQLLSKTNSLKLIKYFSWCVGSRGLIQGQVLDLSEEMNKSFDSLLETHKLKTARLIQCSIVGSYILTKNFKLNIAKKLHRLGYQLGLVFQFLDDLSELSDNEISQHELNINPWILFAVQSQNTLLNGLQIIEQTLSSLNLKATKSVISNYFQKMAHIISQHKNQIRTYNIEDLTTIEQNLKKLTSNYDPL